MFYLISIGSIVAILGGLVAARLVAARMSLDGLKGGVVYSAAAIVTILLLQIISLVFGSGTLENGNNQFVVFDTIWFLVLLFMLCFSYFGLRTKERRKAQN